MRLSISNIAWDKMYDSCMFDNMHDIGFEGLEIAPTRSLGDYPYDDLEKVREWYRIIGPEFVISSMQSIWYGRTERLFGSEKERMTLFDYTRKAILFAEIIGCRNLVFGCPRNRNKPDDVDEGIAVDFFKRLGDYSVGHNTVIGIEANPVIYNTNFLNTTEEALDFIELVSSDGIKLNLDIGTMIQNDEDISVLDGREKYINHVHISEPGLKKVVCRSLHEKVSDRLHKCNYSGYVSVEMGTQNDITDVIDVMKYISEVFAE